VSEVLFTSYHYQTEIKEYCHLASVLLPFYENTVSAKVPYLFENLLPYILQDHQVSSTSVDPISQVSVTTILFLLIVGDCRKQWHQCVLK
jgi:hypothetical protein